MPETTLSAVEIMEGIRKADLTIADRVAIIRTLRDSTPGLVNVDPRLLSRIRAAQSVGTEYIDTTVNALENSEVWQQSASTSPKELRTHLNFQDEHRPLQDEIQAYADILKYNVRYHHWIGVEKSRTAFNVGKAMTGEIGISIRPHLTIIAAARPAVGPKRRKPAEPAPPVVSPVTPKPRE